MLCNKYKDCQFECIHKKPHDRMAYDEGVDWQWFCTSWGHCPTREIRVRCLDESKNLKAWE